MDGLDDGPTIAVPGPVDGLARLVWPGLIKWISAQYNEPSEYSSTVLNTGQMGLAR